jgi:hypothetical protein
MAKVVYNSCYGGFGLSKKAHLLYCEKKGLDPENYDSDRIARHDPILVEVVEELGLEANGICAKLKIDEDDGWYKIIYHDGLERVEWFDPKWEDWIDPNGKIGLTPMNEIIWRRYEFL